MFVEVVRPRMQCPRPVDDVLSGILENTKRETRARFRSPLSLSHSLTLFLSRSLSFSLSHLLSLVVLLSILLGSWVIWTHPIQSERVHSSLKFALQRRGTRHKKGGNEISNESEERIRRIEFQLQTFAPRQDSPNLSVARSDEIDRCPGRR